MRSSVTGCGKRQREGIIEQRESVKGHHRGIKGRSRSNKGRQGEVKWQWGGVKERRGSAKARQRGINSIYNNNGRSAGVRDHLMALKGNGKTIKNGGEALKNT